MELIYQGVDIAGSVDVAECVHHEVSSDRCDMLELVLEHAESWYRWNPKVDDSIIAGLRGYRTGKLYLNTILPENGRYRIFATSVPRAARRSGYRSYENIRLDALMASNAAECGMDGALYGMDSGIVYPFLLRGMESPAKFMSRICKWEGAAFKTAGGRFAGIDIAQIQDESAVQRIEIRADQAGCAHIRRDDLKWSALTIRTPYFECTAYDDGATDGNYIVRTDIPATDEIQAGRWARGILLSNNRQTEEMRIETEFNPGISALARIDLYGNDAIRGEWVVDEVKHDLIQQKSTMSMLRCITTIR